MLLLAEFLVAVFFPEETTLQIRKLVAHVYKKKQIYQPRSGKSFLFYTNGHSWNPVRSGIQSYPCRRNRALKGFVLGTGVTLVSRDHSP